MLRHSVSKRSFGLMFMGLVLALAILAVDIRPNAARADEGGKRSGSLFVTKECSNYTGLGGSYCTTRAWNPLNCPVPSMTYCRRAAWITAYSFSPEPNK